MDGTEIALMTGMLVAAAGVAFAISRFARHLFAGIEPRAVERPRSELAPGVLYAVARCGGVDPDSAAKVVLEVSGREVTERDSVDVFTWAEAFASGQTIERKEALLEDAVKVAMRFGRNFPAAQYDALLDLAFGLGLHGDSIARLRARYAFSFRDYAKEQRPRSADRGGTVASFVNASREELLRTLGLGHDAQRADIVSAYRRLVRQNHPDRFHDAPSEERDRAAARFRSITEAYEMLRRDRRD
jgi:hypothetical protein